MSLFVLSLLFSAQSAWDDPAPTGRWAGSTKQLASELLPPEMAADAVSHVVGLGIVHGGPPSSVRFEGRPSKTPDGFCARKSYYVYIHSKEGSQDGEPQKARVGDKIRLGGCEGIFAHLNPGASLEDGKRALRWLEWARKIAAGGGPLPFALACRDEAGHGRCDAGAREALARLPLEKTFLLTKDRHGQHEWKIGVTETEPGQLLWSVDLDATPGHSSIDLKWQIPPPF